MADNGNGLAKVADNSSVGVDSEWKNPNVEFMKKYGLVLFCGILFLIVSFFSYSSTSSYASQESDMQAKIQKVQADIQNQKDAKQNQIDKLNSNITGMSQNRKDSDDNKMAGLMGKATTWSSYADYENARQDIETTYHMNDDSSFMKTYLPQVKQSTDPAGDSYNIIDQEGLNLKFNWLSSSITKVAVDHYSYFAIVSTTSSSKAGGTSTSYNVLKYDVSTSGDISNLVVNRVFGDPSSFGSMGNS